MTPDTLTTLKRYSAGEISAMQAATLLGEPHSVADVIVMARQAGLQPPRQSPEQERAELDHARRILGIGQ
jgi:hypothetical protein